MPDISKITVLDNVTYNLKDAYALLRVSDSKTFTGIIGTTTAFANCTYYFGTIMPVDYYALWDIKYRITIEIPNQINAKSVADVCIIGHQDTYTIYYAWNAIKNTSYRPSYYHVIYRAKQDGITAGYGHALGESFQYAYNSATAADARNITVEIYETVNCEFTFYNSMMLYASIPGTGSTNYNTYSTLDATTNGLAESGDSNTTDDPQYYWGAKTGTKGVWSTSLSMFNGSGLLENICTAADGTVTDNNRTAKATKIANTNGFRVGSSIYYLGTNYNANTNISGNYVWNSIGLFDSRYSLNTTLTANSLTPYLNVYLTGTVASDGLYYLDTTWWTQTPTDQSKVYVLIGGCYDSTTSNCRIGLYQHNPWLVYNGTNLVPYGSTVTPTKQKLVKTTVPNITSVGSAPTLGTAFSVPNVTGNTSVSASKVTKTDDTFVKTISQAASTSSVIGTVSGGVLTLSKAITAVGAVSAGTTGTASAVSISNVTATNTTLGTAFSIPNVTSVGSAPTLGTAISVATGAVSTSGTGSEVVVDVSSS